MVKVQENPKTQQLWITIPKQVAEFKQWKKGTVPEVIENGKLSVALREKQRDSSTTVYHYPALRKRSCTSAYEKGKKIKAKVCRTLVRGKLKKVNWFRLRGRPPILRC